MHKLNLKATYDMVKIAIAKDDLIVATAERFPGDNFKYVTYPGVGLDEGDIRFILIRLYLEDVLRKRGSEADIDPKTLQDAI